MVGELTVDGMQTEEIYRIHPETLKACEGIRGDKYMQLFERTWGESHRRVARGIFRPEAVDGNYRLAELLERRLNERRAVPAGRVLAGAGTDKNVTLWNCFVSPLVQDSMKTDPNRPGKGIMYALADVAFSMQMGGGVGTDFSPLRPEGALVKRLLAPASGPLAFMDMWNAMCRTVMSAGDRRGAMMATMMCWHPDILKFIMAKHDPGRLRMFNLSVLITDDFMRAKDNDEMWELGHWVPPFEGQPVRVGEKANMWEGGEVRPWYVYEVIPARHLWNIIMESTFKYSEPGIIFVDRINKMNNLWWLEYISCTNPCGEQPLPPDQNCNLSHLNLAMMCTGLPFTDGCSIDQDMVDETARLMVQMSDRVIDLSNIPTPEQEREAQSKRRIGVGITGLANMLMFLRQRYGSPEAVRTAEMVMQQIRDSCYRESIELAKEKGPFPLFDRDKYLQGEFIKTLPEDILDGIATHGIRNSLLNTIAPTGTTSLGQCDNSSSGLECVFAARQNRKVLQRDNSYAMLTVEDFGFRVYANVRFGGDMDKALAEPLPDYMCTYKDLSPRDHIVMQAALQRKIDASVSKTINVPTDISFEDFTGVYDLANEMECKGCTTYREDETSGRGSVLTEAKADGVLVPVVDTPIRERPEVLDAKVYKLRWSHLPYPIFLTVSDEVLPDSRRLPFEVFINSKAVEDSEWQAAFTRLVTSIMRKSYTIEAMAFLVEELKQVWSPKGGEHKGPRYVPSLVALIGMTLDRHFEFCGYKPEGLLNASIEVVNNGEKPIGRICPSCGSPAVIHKEGCGECQECGWSNCK